MTRLNEDLSVEEKVVVFCDMCSSSAILEDLLDTDNMKVLRNLLISIKDFLRRRAAEGGFIAHKFIGDGWVLLFPPDVSGRTLVDLFVHLSLFFSAEFCRDVAPVLQCTPEIIGLTFGVDKGRLIRIMMNEQDEYIGRALNVASRLQGAIKDGDDNPAYKALFSKNAYKGLGISPVPYKVENVTRRLRNLLEGKEIELVKLTLGIPTK